MTVTGLNIPTGLTDAEAEAVRVLARDLDVLELGSHYGASTVVLARVARSVVSVDWHRGDGDTREHFDTLAACRLNLIVHGVDRKVMLCVGKFDFVLPRLAPGFEFGFLDAQHDAASVEWDIGLMTPLLDSDALLACHDYHAPPDGLENWRTFPRFGVAAGIEKAGERWGWRVVDVVETLAILRHPGQRPRDEVSPERRWRT